MFPNTVLKINEQKTVISSNFADQLHVHVERLSDRKNEALNTMVELLLKKPLKFV